MDEKNISLKRVLYIILFIMIGRIVAFIVFLCSFFQIVHMFFSKNKNEKVLQLSTELSSFVKDVTLYVTLASDEKPWPFGEWPKVEH